MPSSNVCWGIEVGAGAVKGVKLERDGENVRVADFVVIPHKKVLSTPELDRDDATRIALGALMSQFRDAMRGASIAVSIPGHSSFARFAKLPPVEPKGVANLVKFEAVQQIPFPIDEVEWDYQTFASEDSPDIEVGIFAVTRERIRERLAVYGEVGLTPDIINLSPVAAYNALAYDLAFTDKTPGTVILDIGTTATDLIIADSGKVWVRTFPLGGHNFTETLASTFKLTYTKAEKLKSEAETSKYKRHIFQAMKPVLSELVQDVQRSIAYYQDTHPEANITRLIGIGSTFKLLGLRKLLSQQLQLDVYRLERFKRATVEGAGGVDFEAATPNLATAYGLALQGVGLGTINANLMPVSVVREAMWRRKAPWFIAAAGVGLAAGGLAFVRPWLESVAVNRARADSAVRSPITQTISLGQRMRSEWESRSAASQPGLLAENIIRLTEGRSLYTSLAADTSAMFSFANEQAKSRASSLAGFDPAKWPLVAELRRFDSAYLLPETPLTAQGGAPASDTGGGGGGDRDSGGDVAAAPEGALAAGPAGAVRLSIVFDSPLKDRALINDTFLAWLRNNANRAGVEYAYVGLPAASDIALTEIAAGAPTTPGAPPPPRPPAGGGAPGSGFGGGGFGGGGGGGGLGGGLGGGDRGDSSPPPDAPAGGRGPAAPRTNPTLEALAPIPADAFVPRPAGPMYRYTIVWYAQLREPGKPVEAGDQTTADASGGEEIPS